MWYSRLLLVAIASIVLAFLTVPGELRDYSMSFIFGYLGMWGRAMDHVERARDGIGRLKGWGLPGEPDILLFCRIATIHEMKGDHEKAMSVYRDEVMPRLRGLFDTGSGGQGDGGLVIATALMEMSNLCRLMGKYEEGLKYANEARSLLSSGSGFSRRVLLEQVDESTATLRELIAVAGKQARYVSTVVYAAKRYHFSRRLSDESPAKDDYCPSKEQCRNVHRYYVPSDALFFIAFVVHVGIVGRYIWRTPHRMGKTSGFFAMIFGLLGLTVYYAWATESKAGKHSFLGSLYAKLRMYEFSLSAYDEARCEVLANPYLEAVMVHECALEIFIGTVSVYNKLGEYDMADKLSEEVIELIKAHSVRGPSLTVLMHYLSLADKYHQRGDDLKTERMKNLPMHGEEGGGLHGLDHDEGINFEIRENVLSSKSDVAKMQRNLKEREAEYARQARRYNALFEKEQKRLTHVMEEEMKKMSTPKRPKPENKTFEVINDERPREEIDREERLSIQIQ